MSHRKYYFNPLTIKEANKFISKNHRHSKIVRSHKFSIGLFNRINNELIGVAIVGRPISRWLDDGLTLEINRLCVLSNNKNICSMIYGRVSKIAKLLGYKMIITYTLESESGTSLLASGFTNDKISKYNLGWIYRNGIQLRLDGREMIPSDNKKRWIRELNQ